MKKLGKSLKINSKICIPQKEIRLTYSRSSGPGGQNVNKLNTKATLRFDINKSRAFDLEEKKRIKKRLAARITRNGILTLWSDRFRSQKANRKDVLEKFADLLQWALRERPARKKTAPSKAAKEKRLAEKRHRSKIKQARKKDLIKDW